MDHSKSKPVAWGREEHPATIITIKQDPFTDKTLCSNFQNLSLGLGSSSNFSFGAQSSSSTQSCWKSTSSTHSYRGETTPPWCSSGRTRRESAPAMFTYNPSHPINIPRTASPTYATPWNNSVQSPPGVFAGKQTGEDESHFSRTLMAMRKNGKCESTPKYSIKGPDTPFSMD